MFIILFLSGGHLNCVVSATFALLGELNVIMLIGYVIMQLFGAILAALFAKVDGQGVVRYPPNNHECRIREKEKHVDNGDAMTGNCQRLSTSD